MRIEDIKAYVKIHLVTIILALFALIVVTSWLLPNQSNTDNKIDAYYSQIAAQYDTTAKAYKDMPYVIALQSKVDQLKTQSEPVKIVKVALYSTLLIIITALLGSLLQFAYTKLKFTEGTDGMRVLSAVIISTTLIIIITFYTFFSK